jgi:hypothetical protein
MEMQWGGSAEGAAHFDIFRAEKWLVVCLCANGRRSKPQ